MAFVDRVDPELVSIFEGLRPKDLSDIPAARAALTALRASLVVPESPHVTVVDRTVPGLAEGHSVRLRIYRPKGVEGQLPCLFWMHGGGHIRGDVEQDDGMANDVVNTVGCAVVSVDWRHAPENPYPAALDDAYAGLRWTEEHSAELGIDPTRIAIGGTSSGGGLAAGLVLRLRDSSALRPCLQVLCAPMLDDRNITPSSLSRTEPKVWNRGANLIAWAAYLGDNQDTVSPYAAPSRATDLSDLPPAFVAVGALDLFLDEDVDYAQRLIQAEVPTELHVYAGAFHSFERVGWQSAVAGRFRHDRSDALRRAFGERPPS